MSESILKFKDLCVEDSFWMKVSSAEKKTWFKVLRIILYPISYPLWWLILRPILALTASYMLWDKKMKRLLKKEKYEEAFSFGFSKLSNWREKESDYKKYGSWPPFESCWWMTFESMCNCGLKLKNPEILEKIWTVFEKRPNGSIGYYVADGLCHMTRVAWSQGEREKAWHWINQSVQSDESYGYSYFLRAWVGAELGLGEPLSDLIIAVRNQPELEEVIYKDETLLREPNLLENLKAELKKTSNGLAENQSI